MTVHLTLAHDLVLSFASRVVPFSLIFFCDIWLLNEKLHIVRLGQMCGLLHMC